MSTSSTTPDLLIAFGPRGFLSLAGAFIIVAGVWHSDRTWDEKGSLAYERAKTSLLRANKNSDGSGVEIPVNDLNDAFPFPIAFIIGWVVFGMSNLFPADGSFTVSPDARSVTAVVVSLALGWIASVPMGEAVRFRDAGKKQKLSLLFLSSWLLLTAVGGPSDTEERYMIAIRAVGAISIIASMKVLWKFRKMGDTWEQHGVPNPNPVVYNAGGPLFVIGWFCFCLGQSATSENTADISGIPIYFTARSALAIASGCGMVPIVLLLDYAHDEGAEFTGFGTDGRFFGRFWESPVPFILAWTLFGVAALLPATDIASVTTLQWTILVNCILQGIDAGVLIQTALYKGDMAGKTRWSIPFVLLFLALAIEIGMGAGGLAWFALPGAFFIVLGQKTVFGDRKRGDYWMEHNTNNPNPIVYSSGEPIFMAGWIIISLAMAIPKDQ
jgi:hypothetical protein